MATRNLFDVSRAEFESTVREGSYVAEDTLEDFTTEEVVEGMNRETRPHEKCHRVSGTSAS